MSPELVTNDGDQHMISFEMECTVDGWKVTATSDTGFTTEVAYATTVECSPLRLVFAFVGPFGQAPTAGDPYQTCDGGLTLTIESAPIECECCCCFQDYTDCNPEFRIQSFVPEAGECLYTVDAYHSTTFENPDGFTFADIATLDTSVCWTYGVAIGTYTHGWIDAVTRDNEPLACLDDDLCGSGYPDEQYSYGLEAYVRSGPAESSLLCRVLVDFVLYRSCNAVAGEPNVRSGWALAAQYYADIGPEICHATTGSFEITLSIDSGTDSGLFVMPSTIILEVNCVAGP